MKKRTIEGQGPRMTKVVEGELIRVGERELMPLVRVTSRVQRRAFVGDEQVGGGGWGFVYMRPIAILERSDAEESRIPIQNETSRAIVGLILAAFTVPLIAVLIIYLARRAGRDTWWQRLA